MLRPEYRWGKDGNGNKKCPYFWSAIQKYGWQNFRHEIVKTGLTKEQAAKLEIELISLYDARNPKRGYNLAKGGYSQTGADNPFFGHKHSQAVKDAVANSNKKRIWTEDAKRRVKEKNSGANSSCAKPVTCVETQITYPTLTDAAKATKANLSKISEVLHGHRKTAGGFHWVFANSQKPNDYPEME